MEAIGILRNIKYKIKSLLHIINSRFGNAEERTREVEDSPKDYTNWSTERRKNLSRASIIYGTILHSLLYNDEKKEMIEEQTLY